MINTTGPCRVRLSHDSTAIRMLALNRKSKLACMIDTSDIYLDQAALSQYT